MLRQSQKSLRRIALFRPLSCSASWQALGDGRAWSCKYRECWKEANMAALSCRFVTLTPSPIPDEDESNRPYIVIGQRVSIDDSDIDHSA
jgi:hypothetical protein